MPMYNRAMLLNKYGNQKLTINAVERSTFHFDFGLGAHGISCTESGHPSGLQVHYARIVPEGSMGVPVMTKMLWSWKVETSQSLRPSLGIP